MLEELVGDVGVDGVGVASCVDTELLGDERGVFVAGYWQLELFLNPDWLEIMGE